MITRTLDGSATTAGLGSDWLGEVLEEAGLRRALNTIGERGPHRLEAMVEGSVVRIEVTEDLSTACGVEVAAALARRAARGGCGAWHVRVHVTDDDAGADLLLREWCWSDRT